MGVTLDEKDLKILDVLRENSKLSTQQISKRTLIPITTIHNRVKKLEREGVIQKYTIVCDKKKIGKNIQAYILVIVDYKFLKKNKIFQDELAAQIKKHPMVDEVYLVTGIADILLKVSVRDIERLNKFLIKELRNIDGVERTQTLVILKEI